MRYVRSRRDKYVALLDRWEQVYSPNPQASARLDSVLADGRHDIVVGRYLRPTVAAGALRHRPVVLDIDDLDFAIWESRLDSPAASPRIRRRAHRAAGRLRAIVDDRLASCRHVWVTKPEDRERIPHVPSSVLPNIPFIADGGVLPRPCAPGTGSRSLLMVASLAYPVNVRAVDRFLDVVWPQIRSRQAQATFRIVGSGMTQRQRSRWNLVEGVAPVGYVDNLLDEYERCLFTVVPVFEGGGTKIKVLESLLHGRTCVVTEHAHRGYASVLPHGGALLVAADENELATHCLELLDEPAKAAALAAFGGDVVRERYTYDRFSRTVAETVRSVLNGEVRSSGGRAIARRSI
jgi:glycosyltransferase involved in cell wall biosynthesis